MRIRRPTERWFEIPNDPDKGRIKIKHLMPGEIREIAGQTIKQDIEYVDGKPIFRQTFDKKTDREETLRRSVIAWENFFDAEGNPLECTLDNIILCSDTIEGFDALVKGLQQKLAEDIAKEDKDQEKN